MKRTSKDRQQMDDEEDDGAMLRKETPNFGALHSLNHEEEEASPRELNKIKIKSKRMIRDPVHGQIPLQGIL